jgi:diguanylate cyclase (GGDEF)-like protein
MTQEGSFTEPPVAIGDLNVPAALHQATRRLIGVTNAEQACEIGQALVYELGGSVEEAFTASGDVMPMDISLGQARGFFPSAQPGTPARTAIETYLPIFLEDARRALEQRYVVERLARDAGVDPLTGLADRVAMSRLMARLSTGDLLVALDLDDFRELNEQSGRQAGDDTLRAFAQALRQTTRANEACSRMGGDEFLVVLYQSKATIARSFLARLGKRWTGGTPPRPTFSAGFASVEANDWRSALAAAERALVRAKRAGPAAWESAEPRDYDVE